MAGLCPVGARFVWGYPCVASNLSCGDCGAVTPVSDWVDKSGGAGTGERLTAKIVRGGIVESLPEACVAWFHGVWLTCFFVSEGLGISSPGEVAAGGAGEEISLCVASYY